MKTLTNWLTVIFMTMYWIFRIVVCVNAAQNVSFFVRPINFQVEIITLFITLFCIILVARRKIAGAIIYIIMYASYFGTDLFTTLIPAIKNFSINADIIIDSASSIFGVILAIVALMDLTVEKSKVPDQKKTDWFYENKKFDRDLDDRADKNNYKLL